MKTTIEQLWNGNITPGRNCGENDPEIQELVELMEQNRELLDKNLGASQQEILQKYIDCTEEYCCRIAAQAFSDGFRLAGRLLTEVLSD